MVRITNLGQIYTGNFRLLKYRSFQSFKILLEQGLSVLTISRFSFLNLLENICNAGKNDLKREIAIYLPTQQSAIPQEMSSQNTPSGAMHIEKYASCILHMK